VNAIAAYRVNSRLTLRLNVENLTDEFYAISTNWGAQRVILGPARSVLLSTDVRF
jgi:catecholate siderophore receptor